MPNKQKTLDELPKMTEADRKELAETEQELNGDFQRLMAKPLNKAIKDILTKSGGSCNELSIEQQAEYKNWLCAKMGIDPELQPVDIIPTKKGLRPYLNKGASEQMRVAHKISITSINAQSIDDMWLITCSVRDFSGRIDSDIGAYPKYGTDKSPMDAHDALMKAVTKAKRRVTLSMCGVGAIVEEAHPSEYNGNGNDQTETVSRTNVLIKDTTEMKRIFHDVVMSKVDEEELPNNIWKVIISQSMRLANTTEFEEAARWLQENGSIQLNKDDNGNIVKAAIKEVKNGTAKG